MDSDLMRYIARQQRRDAKAAEARAGRSTPTGGGITRNTVEALVLKATDSLLIGPDYTTVLQIGDILQRKPKWTDTVTDSVKERLKVREKDVQMRCLELIEACVKNVPESKSRIGSKDFLGQLKKLAVAKDTELEVKNKLLDLIQSWAEEFPSKKDYGFSQVYEEMRRKGVTFPSFSQAVSTHYESQRAHTKDKRSGTADLEMVENNAELLREMLTAVDPVNEDVRKNDIVQELLSSCKAAHPGLRKIIESGKASESRLERALILNDKLVWINEAYAELLRGKRPAALQERQPDQAPRPRESLPCDEIDGAASVDYADPLPSLARPPPRARQPPAGAFSESIFTSPPRSTVTVTNGSELDEFDLLARRHAPPDVSTVAQTPFPPTPSTGVLPASTPLDDPFAALILRPSPAAPPVGSGIDFLFRDSSVSTPPPAALGFSPLSSPLLQPVQQTPLSPVPLIPPNTQSLPSVYPTSLGTGKESLI